MDGNKKLNKGANIILYGQDYIKNIFKMSGKQKLIDSMSNLIHHVFLSRAKQQEIFDTLSAEDLRKMLSNLEDDNENVRKITLVLLAGFLFGNQSTQRRFCQLTATPEFQGKIVLSSKFPKPILNDKLALKEVFQIIKSKPKQGAVSDYQPKICLFWYIDSRAKYKNIQIGTRNNFSVDPLHCVVGVWVSKNRADDMKQLVQAENCLSQEKMAGKHKIKLSSNVSQQKDPNYLFIPETPTKSTLAQQPCVVKSPNWLEEQYTTPIRTKPQISFLCKTEPVAVRSVQFPVSHFQTPGFIKGLGVNKNIYINCYSNWATPYPAMYGRGPGDKNQQGVIYQECRPHWQNGGQGSSRQEYRR